MLPSCADQLLQQLLLEKIDTLPLQCRHIEQMHEGVWFRKNIFDKMTAKRTSTIFPKMDFVYAWIVPSWADQLLPQFLMGQFDTLPIQCRHIELMREGVWFEKYISDKMTAKRT